MSSVKMLFRILVASLLVATHLAVSGLRGQTVSLGSGSAHAHRLADGHSHGPMSVVHHHRHHHHHHDHHDEPAPAEPHSHDGQGTHVHLSLDGWARIAARVAVDLPHRVALIPPPAIAVVAERVALESAIAAQPVHGAWQPPDGDLAALRGIRLHV